MFERHVKNRLSAGKWNAISLKDGKDNMGEAFNQAIGTEVAKKQIEIEGVIMEPKYY